MINEEVLGQIEKAFDIKLYDWQRDYLLDKPFKTPTSSQSGRSFAKIIKLLLTTEIKEREIRSFAKYESIHRQIYFEKQVLEIDNKLKSAGIKTKLIRQGGMNNVI